MQENISYEFKNRAQELTRLEGLLNDFKTRYLLSDQNVFDLNLTLEEVLTNTIRYGYPNNQERIIRVDFTFEPTKILVCIIDDAAPFNPVEQVKEPDMTSDIFDRKVGGLGVFLVKKVMSEIFYRREEDKNILQMTMNRDPAHPTL